MVYPSEIPVLLHTKWRRYLSLLLFFNHLLWCAFFVAYLTVQLRINLNVNEDISNKRFSAIFERYYREMRRLDKISKYEMQLLYIMGYSLVKDVLEQHKAKYDKADDQQAATISLFAISFILALIGTKAAYNSIPGKIHYGTIGAALAISGLSFLIVGSEYAVYICILIAVFVFEMLVLNELHDELIMPAAEDNREINPESHASTSASAMKESQYNSTIT